MATIGRFEDVKAAKMFAMVAHAGQKRRYTEEDYFEHCERVAMAVAEIEGDIDYNMVAAAYLHDTVEDTEVTYELICEWFGSVITEIVQELTDTAVPSDGNRAERKAIERARLINVSCKAKTIKILDRLDNLSSVMKHDPGFAPTYLKESVLLLPCLRGGDDRWWSRLEAVVRDQPGYAEAAQLLS